MTSMLHPLSIFQWGIETVKGTAVPATSKIALTNMEFSALDEFDRLALMKGLLLPHSGNEIAVKRGTTWRISDSPVVMNQQQHWLSMAVVGGIIATGVGPYLWDFTRNPLAVPALSTFTIERRLTDGANHADNEFAYSFLTQISWTFEPDQVFKFSAEGVSRRVQASTLTAAQAMPTVAILPAPLALVSMDSAWANLGVTPMAGQVRKAVITFKTGFMPDDTLDARTDLDFYIHRINAEQVGVELELTVRLTKAQYDAQKAAAEAGTLRAVRVLIDDAANSLSMTFDMLLKHVNASAIEVENSDGQVDAVFRMQESTDNTNFFKVGLENNIGTYA